MQKHPPGSARESGYKRIADALREEVLAGIHPNGIPFNHLELQTRFGVGSEAISNSLRVLRSEGLAEYQMVRGKNKNNRRTVVTFEGGGSPERM